MSLVWNFILNILGVALALWVAVGLVPDVKLYSDESSQAATFIAAASIMVFVNWIVAPVIKLVSFPLTCLTLGLFTLVTNVIVLYIVAKFFNEFAIGHLEITGFLPAVYASTIISAVSTTVNFFTHPLRHL